MIKELGGLIPGYPWEVPLFNLITPAFLYVVYFDQLLGAVGAPKSWSKYTTPLHSLVSFSLNGIKRRDKYWIKEIALSKNYGD